MNRLRLLAIAPARRGDLLGVRGPIAARRRPCSCRLAARRAVTAAPRGPVRQAPPQPTPRRSPRRARGVPLPLRRQPEFPAPRRPSRLDALGTRPAALAAMTIATAPTAASAPAPVSAGGPSSSPRRRALWARHRGRPPARRRWTALPIPAAWHSFTLVRPSRSTAATAASASASTASRAWFRPRPFRCRAPCRRRAAAADSSLAASSGADVAAQPDAGRGGLRPDLARHARFLTGRLHRCAGHRRRHTWATATATTVTLLNPRAARRVRLAHRAHRVRRRAARRVARRDRVLRVPGARHAHRGRRDRRVLRDAHPSRPPRPAPRHLSRRSGSARRRRRGA